MSSLIERTLFRRGDFGAIAEPRGCCEKTTYVGGPDRDGARKLIFQLVRLEKPRRCLLIPLVKDFIDR